MFNTKQTREYTPLSSRSILNLITEEEIYERYLGFPIEMGRCYPSVLRDNDLTPSLNFYINKRGNVCYKDFGHSQGNVFQFVMSKFDEDYVSAIKRVNRDFKLGLGPSDDIISEVKPNRIQFIKRVKRQFLIQFKPRNWSKIDQDYWNSFGITLETLKKYNVFVADRVWLNKQLRFIYTDQNPIYAYVFGNKVKIYRPLSELKWTNNATADIMQGYDQLPKTGELLIITKSLKDVMLFYENGIAAIAPQGEGMYIPDDVIKELKERFNRIIVVYDNDESGVKNSIRISSSLGFEYWNIPKSFETKDPTDFYKEYGRDKFNELLKSLINGKEISPGQ